MNLSTIRAAQVRSLVLSGNYIVCPRTSKSLTHSGKGNKATPFCRRHCQICFLETALLHCDSNDYEG